MLRQQKAGTWPVVTRWPARHTRLLVRAGEYAFILPALLLLCIVALFPIITAIQLSFNKVSLVPPNQAFLGFSLKFIRLDNYVEVLSDADFWGAVAHSTTFTALTVIGSLSLGLAFALMLDSSIRGRTIWRLLLLSPWTVAPVVAGSTWSWIFDARYGVLNALLRIIDPSAQPVLWLANPYLAMLSVSIANIWIRMPFMMIMLLAGMQAVPVEEYEAAAVDGASAFDRFRYITLPHLRFTVMVATVLLVIWDFKHFDIVQVMTAGGPGRATELLSTLTFKTSFVFFRFGPAAAMGTLIMLVLLAFTALYVKLLRTND